MSKIKKTSKSAKLPQPIKVKKEKLEEDRTLHSMTHFIDDRVELVKQIFGSLKTKTITNLAPEYLKEKDMDEIQELCLNELLCLSKKRLLSIINATKCPTDTESSEDSDVEAKEEHISLEEISSESDLENGDKSTKKSGPRTKKNLKKANQADNKNEGDGQMSVLELLELQARARAIRSQLALEPVTKIEVDSDDETVRNANVTSTTKEQKSNRKRKKGTAKEAEKDKPQFPLKDNGSSDPKESVSSQSETVNSNVEKMHSTNSSQKIKLKRNFRKQNQTVLEADSSDQEKVKFPKLKEEKDNHSPSPDVIPIEPEPETLCISDSGSDKEEAVLKPVKEKEAAVDPSEEAEDGEIIEGENSSIGEDQPLETPFTTDNTDKTEKLKEDKIESNKISIIENEVLVKPPEIQSVAETLHEDQATAISNGKDSSEDRKANDENSVLSTTHDPDMDGDHNDDVISIEGGDLETEMSEHLDKDNSSNSINSSFSEEKRMKDRKDDHDIISLDSSDNEGDCMQDDNIESWHARYLKSSKVSKVLAVSRLGKRVRDKLKTSKLSKRETSHDINKEKDSDHFKSKHEEGSVDHYKELLELTHRKT